MTTDLSRRCGCRFSGNLAAALFGVWPSDKEESTRLLGEIAEDDPSIRTDKEPRRPAHD